MLNYILDHIDISIIVLSDIKPNENNSIFYITYVNKSMMKILDIDSDLKLLNKDKLLMNIHDDYINNEIDTYNGLFNKKNNSSTVCKILCDGNCNWYEIKKMYNSEKKMYFITCKDIDKLTELQTGYIPYNKMGNFVANTTHELVTPLNGIIGMITLLDDTNITVEQNDYINILKECSTNLLTIINDILDFSKLEAGKITLNLECIQLKSCFDNVKDILSTRLLEKDLELILNINENIPKDIQIDKNRFKQILLNLINNSIKFTNNGTIVIDVNIASEIDNELFLQIDITDTGCGIEKNDIHKLFKSFSQIDNHIMSEGTGLGLIICKQLVLLMNGKIWLNNSEVNKGSTFSFVIKTLKCLENITLTEIDINIFKNRKVFILDDNRENRLGLINLVNKWGMIPITFSSAIEALYMIKLHNYQFDIGFVDVCMPEMSGKEFAIKLIKQNNNMISIPLIALSSSYETSEEYVTYFVDNLYKPINENSLKKICFNLLNKNHSITKDNIISYANKNKTIINKILKGINILLVEDVVINQKVILKFLHKLGYTNIDVSENGKECLNMMTKNKYDLILLDIKMPIMNGEEVYEYINNYYNYDNTKQNESKEWVLLNVIKPYIIAVTAYSLKEDKDKFLQIGFDDYIPKPINIKILEQVMNTFLYDSVIKPKKWLFKV